MSRLATGKRDVTFNLHVIKEITFIYDERYLKLSTMVNYYILALEYQKIESEKQILNLRSKL